MPKTSTVGGAPAAPPSEGCPLLPPELCPPLPPEACPPVVVPAAPGSVPPLPAEAPPLDAPAVVLGTLPPAPELPGAPPVLAPACSGVELGVAASSLQPPSTTTRLAASQASYCFMPVVRAGATRFRPDRSQVAHFSPSAGKCAESGPAHKLGTFSGRRRKVSNLRS